MHPRNFLLVAVVAGLVTIPAAPAAHTSGPVIVASGGVHWTIQLPNPFGVEVRNQPLSFNAMKYTNGSVGGQFE